MLFLNFTLQKPALRRLRKSSHLPHVTYLVGADVGKQPHIPLAIKKRGPLHFQTERDLDIAEDSEVEFDQEEDIWVCSTCV